MSDLYDFIGDHAAEFPASTMCAALGISRAGYCRHRAGLRSVRSIGDESLGRAVTEIFWHHRRRYGARRIHRQLLRDGAACGLGRVRRLMALLGLRPLQKRGFVPKTSDGQPGAAACPNLLLDRGAPASINEVWVGDITYVPLSDGWAYLAVLMDLCSRRIIAWELADNMCAGLVLGVLRTACELRGRHPGLILHSDQGSQYGAADYRQAAASWGMRQSMSRRGNCYDNAFMESCFGTLKCEMLEDGIFEDLADARAEVFDYIGAYYNRQRLHSSIGYETPEQYEIDNFQK
jgi:transposase InsO family protein